MERSLLGQIGVRMLEQMEEVLGGEISRLFERIASRSVARVGSRKRLKKLVKEG